MDQNTACGLAVAASVFLFGLGIYLVCDGLRKLLEAIRADRPVPPPCTASETLRILHAAYGDHWTYTSLADPPGRIVLAWREWSGQCGGTKYRDRALDVLLVRPDGSVEVLGTCVEYEVFGPPKEGVIC